ncbi:MAG: dTDP-4-dehydrorhamnose 3,5-epimerase [Candidatus Omnitrophica bacterium]|nr:dTDP-4-dehydrorhamnose 3,5-epimerase [Candidatus Omnitrophota bacterium]
MPFKFKKLEIPGLVLVEPEIYGDDRGYFLELYRKNEFEKAGITKPFVQVDHSKSKKNVVRGLHYQKDPMAQAKMVDVIEGSIFDVVVDIRKGSPSFGKWLGVILGGAQRQLLYIPEGFAHGFCVVSETAHIIYYCTQIYMPEYQRGILWNDPEMSISWPVEDPVLSDKDKKMPPLSQADNTFVFKTFGEK